jgi:hypothetical protein
MWMPQSLLLEALLELFGQLGAGGTGATDLFSSGLPPLRSNLQTLCLHPAKAQASLHREVQYDDKHFVREHRDATPLTWGRDFPYKLLVRLRRMELAGTAGSS